MAGMPTGTMPGEKTVEVAVDVVMDIRAALEERGIDFASETPSAGDILRSAAEMIKGDGEQDEGQSLKAAANSAERRLGHKGIIPRAKVIANSLHEFGQQKICTSKARWIDGDLIERGLPKLTQAERKAIERQ